MDTYIDMNAVMDVVYEEMSKEELIAVIKQREQTIKEMSLRMFNENLVAASLSPQSLPKHPGGRPRTYDQQLIDSIAAYKRDGHTYRDTASHFGVSIRTVQRYCEG